MATVVRVWDEEFPDEVEEVRIENDYVLISDGTCEPSFQVWANGTTQITIKAGTSSRE